jgi:hypothetical protein
MPDAAGSATPLAAIVQLNVGTTQLRGSLLSSTDLQMKSSFGEVTIPLSEVAGIKLASEGNATTTVVLHNGDSVTGACDLPRVELQTEWGTATINGSAVNSILFAQGMAWVSEEGLSGTRWALMEKPEGGEGEEEDGGEGEGDSAAKPAAAKRDFKPGEIIVVTRDSQLKVDERIIGTVNQNEVFAVEKVTDGWVWINTGKFAGWLYDQNIAPYQEPRSGGSSGR